MYELEFIDAATGDTIGTAPREAVVPAEGRGVVLEHAVFGPVWYRVAKHDEHWYSARVGRLAKPDQYAGKSVKVYLEPVEARR